MPAHSRDSRACHHDLHPASRLNVALGRRRDQGLKSAAREDDSHIGDSPVSTVRHRWARSAYRAYEPLYPLCHGLIHYAASRPAPRPQPGTQKSTSRGQATGYTNPSTNNQLNRVPPSRKHVKSDLGSGVETTARFRGDHRRRVEVIEINDFRSAVPILCRFPGRVHLGVIAVDRQ